MTRCDDAGSSRIRDLRTELDKGIRSLDAGNGLPLDLKQFLVEARKNQRPAS
jgi:hypothetical protein